MKTKDSKSECIIMSDEMIAEVSRKQMEYKKSPQALKDKQDEVNEQIEQYIESRIKEYKDRAQEVEGLVLLWRAKLKEQLFMEQSFHQPESITDSMIYEEVEKDLQEFDEHFNISVLRNGAL